VDPLEYVRALRRRWYVIVAFLVVALAIGWATTAVGHAAPKTKTPPRQYSASDVILNIGSPNGQSQAGFGNLQTLATLINLPDVAKLVAKDLHYSGDPRKLTEQVGAFASPDTGLLTINANDTDPNRAKLLADTFADDLLLFLQNQASATNSVTAEAIKSQMTQLSNDIKSLEQQINAASGVERDLLQAALSGKVLAYNSLQTRYQFLASQVANVAANLVIIQRAVPDTGTTGAAASASSAKKSSSAVTRLLLAGILGLLAGIALALVLDRFDTRLRNKKAAEKAFGLPVLAEIPLVPRLRRWRLGDGLLRSRDVPVVMPAFPRVGDAFRLLGAGVSRGPLGNGIGQAGDGNGHNGTHAPSGVVLVTSGGPSEGKTTVVANLALTFAQAQRSVIVLSCDFRHPQIHRLFDVPNTVGLAEALQASSGPVLNGHIKPTPVPDMRLVPSGGLPKNAAGLLSSDRMREAIEEARQQADIVLIDSPPLLTSAEVTHLFPLVDSVLVVGRARKTTQELAERTGELLKRLEAPVAGVALNGATELPLSGNHIKYWQVVK
jgi:capsular exopolysaccharide synthesis family protein